MTVYEVKGRRKNPLGKGIMFMFFVWIIVCIAGSVMQGHIDFARTLLTVAIDDDDTTINVRNTQGFPESGIIVIGNERIAYSSTSNTSFNGNPARPLIRGTSGTTAVAHSAGAHVTTVPGSMLNSAANYNIAAITDSAGLMAFVSVPLAVFALLGSFFFLPLQFLGTDLQILTILWAVIGVGMLVALTIALSGGRRV